MPEKKEDSVAKCWRAKSSVGGHERGLRPVFRRLPAQSRRHGGFAAAHVALHQTAHRGIPRHIGHGLPHGAALRARGRKGQKLPEFLCGVLCHAPAGFPPFAVFEQEQRDLEQEQLLKDEAPLGLLQRLHGGGKMNVLQGLPQRAQAV